MPCSYSSVLKFRWRLTFGLSGVGSGHLSLNLGLEWLDLKSITLLVLVREVTEAAVLGLGQQIIIGGLHCVGLSPSQSLPQVVLRNVVVSAGRLLHHRAC